MPTDVITLYGRPGCHLCDEARAALDGLRRDGAAFELRSGGKPELMIAGRESLSLLRAEPFSSMRLVSCRWQSRANFCARLRKGLSIE